MSASDEAVLMKHLSLSLQQHWW